MIIMEWSQEAKDLFEELLSPIPVFARPMAKRGIEKKIVEVTESNEVTVDNVVQGYILASPEKDRERVKKVLTAKKVDFSKYEDLF